MQSQSTYALSLAVESLNYALATPSQENRIADLFKNVFRVVSGTLTSALNVAFGGDDVSKIKATYLNLPIYKKITPANFFTFAEGVVPTRQAFSGKYVPFGKIVLEDLEYFEMLDVSLRETKSLVGRLIQDAEVRASFLPANHLSAIKESQARRKAMNDAVGGFLKAPKSEASATIRTLIDCVQDLHELDALATKISSKLGGIDLASLNERSNHINDLVIVLGKEIASKNITDLTKDQISHLSNTIAEVANQLEHAGFVYYNAMTFLRQVNDLQEAASAVV